jgi:hypothetical protein
MMHKYFALFAALPLALVACDREQSSGDTADTTTTASDTAKGFEVEGDDLSFEQGQVLGREWVDAVNKRDWSRLTPMFRDNAVVVTRDSALLNRVTTDVWKSQLSTQQHVDLEVLEEFDFTTLPSGAFLRSNAESVGKSKMRFTGTWDLLVRLEDGKAKVSSVFERQPRPSSDAAPDRHLGSIVVADGLLLEAQPKELHERGFRTLVDPAGRAELWVKEKSLPIEWQRYKGKDFVVTDASGTRCQTKVQGFRYYARTAVPAWLNDAWAAQSDSKKGARTAGEAAWTMAGDDAVSLVARFEPGLESECPNPVFARMQGAPGYTVYNRRDNTSMSEQDIVAAIRDIPYAQQLTEKVSGMGGKDLIDDSKIELRQFVSKDRHFVSATFTDDGACNDVIVTMYFIWEVRGDRLVLLNDPSRSHEPFIPEYVADANNDGSPEFYGRDMIVRESGGTFRVVEDVRPMSFDSGC